MDFIKPFIRAISEEQKRVRKRMILDEAFALFDQGDFDTTGMAELARRSGLAKGSIFLYFKTKEELFMQMLAEDLGRWNDSYDARLVEAGDRSIDRDDLALLFIGVLEGHARLVRLVALVNRIFDQNLSHEQVATFKKEFIRRIRSTGALLDAKVRCFKEGDGLDFYIQCYVLITGLANLANPVPSIRDVVQNPDFAILQFDFWQHLTRMLRMLLKGMENS